MSSRPTKLDLTASAPEIVEVYAAAFGEPPWNEGPDEVAAFAARLAHEREAGAAGVGLDIGGRLHGFAYALPTPVPFPSGRAYDRVARICDPDRLAGRWEVMEVAVHPEARGRGCADLLLSALLADYSPAWLLTSVDAGPALRFYSRRPDLTRCAEGEGLVVFLT